VRRNPVAELDEVDPRQQRLAGTQQQRRYREVHLVDESCAQVLPDRGRAAAETNVLPARPTLRSCSPFCRPSSVVHIKATDLGADRLGVRAPYVASGPIWPQVPQLDTAHFLFGPYCSPASGRSSTSPRPCLQALRTSSGARCRS
jgi:hypothetical protein